MASMVGAGGLGSKLPSGAVFAAASKGQPQHVNPGPLLLGRASRGGPPPRGADEKAAPLSLWQAVEQSTMNGMAEPKEVLVNRRPKMLSELVGQDTQPSMISPFGASACQPRSPTAGPSPTAAPLRLADALGFGFATPQAAAPVAPERSQAVEPASRERQQQEEALDAFIFGFTIRVAGGTELGLATSVPTDPVSGKDALYLRIDTVLPGGAVDAWNRQCGSSGAPEKVLLAGDKIIRVNAAGETDAMRREFATSRLLRMLIVRTPSDTQEQGAVVQRPQPSATTSQQKPVVLSAAQFPQASNIAPPQTRRFEL